MYCKIFCAARRIVLDEIRAQLHLEVHCHLDMEPTAASHPTPAVMSRQLNSDIQTNQSSPSVKQHRSSSASTTVSTHLNTYVLYTRCISAVWTHISPFEKEIYSRKFSHLLYLHVGKIYALINRRSIQFVTKNILI